MNGAVTGIRNFTLRYSHINWALADQAMVSGVNFLTGILLARYLGLAEYGRFTLVWMAVLFFNSLQQAAIISPMMSIGPKQDNNQEPQYYGAVFLQQVIWTGASAALMFAGAWGCRFFRPDWDVQGLVFPLVAALVAYQFQDFLRRYFFVRNRASVAFLNDCISYLGQLLLLVVLFRSSLMDTKLALWVIAGTSFMAVGVGLFGVGKLDFCRSSEERVTKQHWQFSKWLISSALLRWASGSLFTIAAASLLGATAAGAMRAGQNILGVVQVLFLGLGNVVPATSARILVESGVGGFVLYLKKMGLLCTGLTVLFSLAISIDPDRIMQLVYGGSYPGYGYVLRWYAVTYVVISLGTMINPGLTVLENTRPIFMAYAITAVISIAAATKLVSAFGIVGALAGDLLVQMIFHSILILALARDLKRVKKVSWIP